MKKYRLKPEAVKFFEKKYSKEIKSLPFWEDLKINMNALEEVEKVYLTFGIKSSECCTDLHGWNREPLKANFHFTLNVIDISNKEYQVISDDDSLRELMNKIQSTVNNFIHVKLTQ